MEGPRTRRRGGFRVQPEDGIDELELVRLVGGVACEHGQCGGAIRRSSGGAIRRPSVGDQALPWKTSSEEGSPVEESCHL